MNHSENLLQQLEPVVRALSAERSSLPPSAVGGAGGVASSSGLPFQHLIDQAVAGELTTGRRITLAAGLELGEAELERIASAADRAEAAGGTRAVVFLPNDIYVLDIPKRRLTESIRDAGGEFGPAPAPNTGPRLDSPRWRVETTAEALPGEPSPAPPAPPAPPSSPAPRGTTAGELEPRLGLVIGGNEVRSGERIISGIDTAILLDRAVNEADRTGDSVLQMFTHLRGPVLDGAAELQRISG